MDGCGTLRGVQYLKILRHKIESNQQSQWIFRQNHLQHLPQKRIKQKAESKYSFVSSKDFSFRPAFNQLRNLFKTSGPSKKEASTCFVFCFDAHPAEKAWNEANTPKNRRPPGAKRTIPAVMDWFGGIQMSSFSWAVVKTCEMIGKPKPVNP